MMKTTILHKVLFASLLLLASCTEVEVCDEAKHPHQGTFRLTYDWGAYTQEGTDQLYLVTTRILNTHHNVYLVNSKGKFLVEDTGTPEKPETPEIPEVPVARQEEGAGGEGEAPVVPPVKYKEENSIPILGGEYFMMTFTSPVTGKATLDAPDKVELINMDSFLEDKSVGVNQIMMRHVNTKPSVVLGDKKWEDLNPGYGYVFEPERQYYVARCDYLELYTGKEYVQPFVFQPLMQHLHFEFAVDLLKDEETGEQLNIDPSKGDAVVAEVSGIVPLVTLSNGLLNTSEIKKMIVDVRETSRESTAEGTTIHYKASLHTFGLMGGMDKQTISGPGIFRIGVYFKERLKTVRAVSNLAEQIEQAGLTEMTGKPNERIKLKNEATIKIETHLRLKVSAVGDNNNNEGISGWISEGNDVDVEI